MERDQKKDEALRHMGIPLWRIRSKEAWSEAQLRETLDQYLEKFIYLSGGCYSDELCIHRTAPDMRKDRLYHACLFNFTKKVRTMKEEPFRQDSRVHLLWHQLLAELHTIHLCVNFLEVIC